MSNIEKIKRKLSFTYITGGNMKLERQFDSMCQRLHCAHLLAFLSEVKFAEIFTYARRSYIMFSATFTGETIETFPPLEKQD